MLAHLTGQFLRLASSLIMTRLLVPEMFGIMAIVTMVQIVLTLLSDIGLRQAIIQSPRGDSQEFLNTAWSVQIIRGFLIWGGCLLVALALWSADSWNWFPVGSVYASPELPAVLAVSSMAAILVGFQSTKLITANRDLNLRTVTSIELSAQVAGLVVSGVLGWLTRSIWSFVAGGLFSAGLSTLLSHLWIRGKANRFAWDHSSLKELFGYGRWVLLSSLLFVLAANGDRLLLGVWFEAATLGIYTIALNLATMIEGAGSRLFASVAMPALSEVARGEKERLRFTYFRMRLPFDVGFIGSAGALFALGPALVSLMYDARYTDAGYMLQILSFTLIFARFGLAGSAYLALGEPRNLVWIHIVKLLAIFVLVPLGYHFYGLSGALCGIAFHALFTLPLIHYFNRRHSLNNLSFELAVLFAWPVGWSLGWLLSLLLRH